MKIFALNHNSIMNDVLEGFEVVETPWEADKIVLWSDVTPLAKNLIDMAKTRGIPTVVLQHGRRGSSRYYPPFNEQIEADEIYVWGEADKEGLVGAGHDLSKIFVTGTTVLDHVIPRKDHEGINVVFCPEHWDKEVDENKKTIKELNKLTGVNITSKIIEGHDNSLYPNPVFSDRNSPDHLSICADVLSTADIVVGISESTFELMAQAMDIPVVIMEEWKPKACGGDERYKDNYRRIISKGSKRSTLKSLTKTIKQQLSNPDELREARKEVVIYEGGGNLNAKDEITRLLKR